MLIKLNSKHHKKNFTHNEILNNMNTEVILVNTLFVKEITPFDISEINIGLAFGYFNYLYGSKSTIWYSDFEKIHVVESVEDIHLMLNGENK
jgi:hypothetical protein